MITLELTEGEAQIILNALVKEPYINVVDLINKIQNQASEQIQEKDYLRRSSLRMRRNSP